MSGAHTAIGFNITALIHITYQQILPHFEQSHAALAAIKSARGGSISLDQFSVLMHSEFTPVMTRCPDHYLEDVSLSRDLPFLLAKDPTLIMLSGWIATYTRNLKSILNDRNQLINKATIGGPEDGLDLRALEWQIETQATIANAEIVNVYQLFQQFDEVTKKITNIIGSEYKGVTGPKLKVAPPDVLGPLMTELEQIARGIVPDWPPPEPPAM